jgi:MSHA biogenesis protein MshL
MRKSNLKDLRLIILLVTLLLCACTPNFARYGMNTQIPQKEETKKDIIDEPPPPIPPELGLAPLMEIEPGEEKLFSFSAKGLSLEDILHPLSKEAGFNIIWDKEVNPRAKVSVTFEDLTLDEALETIFAPTEYLHSINSPTLHVKLTDTRTFELGHVPNKIVSQMQVGGDVLGSIQEAGGITGQFQITSDTDPEAMDLWKQVEEGMEKIISSEGEFFINRFAGLVTMTDRKRNLRMAESFIGKLKRNLNRQVSIEAEVVEVTLENSQSYGIDWSAIHSFLMDNKTTQVTGTQSLSLGGSVVEFTGSRHDASVVLNALGKYGEVNVLSKPRVNVLNGQTAMINVGRVISYWELTGLSGGVSGGVVGQPVIFPEQKTVLLGLTMGVTPSISSDNYVTLQIVPIVTDVSTWSEFQFEQQTLRAPNVDIREASTLVGIKNGETVVIGGLITSKKSDTEHKIPLLGDIPGLGYFFKRKEKTEQRAELVIFLTPKITSLYNEEG